MNLTEEVQQPEQKKKPSYLGLAVFGGIFAVICAIGSVQGALKPTQTSEEVKGLSIEITVAPTATTEPSKTPEPTVEIVQPTSVPTIRPTTRPTSKPVVIPSAKSEIKSTVIPVAPKQEQPMTISGGDKDCGDFATQSEAQSYFNGKGGSSSNNVDDLDRDHDGVACEKNP